jgi:uncharacterized membrane-anchored protein YitT (DUF2179 family)
MKKTFIKIHHQIRDYVVIFLGTVLYAFGFNGFILSNEIVPGGLTGISSLIYYRTGIPVSLTYAVVNVVLLAFAFRILGKRFIINSLFGIISLTCTLSCFDWLLDSRSLVDGEPFMSLLIGAVLCGTGLGIIFSSNGSTGGTDIVGAIVNKYKNITIGRALLYCDFVIIACSYLIFHSIDKIVFGYVLMFTEMYLLDRVLNANNQSVQFLIFSRRHQAIVQAILCDLGRGCTILNGEGGYSKEPVKVIIILAKKKESSLIIRLVKSIDKQAFISQGNVQGVYGEGFEQLKT